MLKPCFGLGALERLFALEIDACAADHTASLYSSKKAAHTSQVISEHKSDCRVLLGMIKQSILITHASPFSLYKCFPNWADLVEIGYENSDKSNSTHRQKIHWNRPILYYK